jgi:zinc transport system substrate-binding protein
MSKYLNCTKMILRSIDDMAKKMTKAKEIREKKAIRDKRIGSIGGTIYGRGIIRDIGTVRGIGRINSANMALLLLLALSIAILSLGAFGRVGTPAAAASKEDPDAPIIIASTSWTAAIASAATGCKVDYIASGDLRHPPEYDFRVSDIKRVVEADYIIWAGYEGFIKELIDAADIPESKLILISTDNVPGKLIQETGRLARILGTEPAQRRWEQEYKNRVNDILLAAKRAYVPGQNAVVQSFLKTFAEWLGYNVVGTFGGGEEMTPVKLAELVKLSPDIVIDNWHNSLGEPIAAALGCRYALLINFPGKDRTISLIDVLKYNARELGII